MKRDVEKYFSQITVLYLRFRRTFASEIPICFNVQGYFSNRSIYF